MSSLLQEINVGTALWSAMSVSSASTWSLPCIAVMSRGLLRVKPFEFAVVSGSSQEAAIEQLPGREDHIYTVLSKRPQSGLSKLTSRDDVPRLNPDVPAF